MAVGWLPVCGYLENSAVCDRFVGRADGIVGSKLCRDVGAKGLCIGRSTEVEERRVGAAFDVHLDIVVAGANCQGEAVTEVIACFTENAELLVSTSDVIAKYYASRGRVPDR